MNNGYVWSWWVFTIAIIVLVAAFWRYLSTNTKWVALIFVAILLSIGMVFFVNWKSVKNKMERGVTWYYIADVESANDITTQVSISNGNTGDEIGNVTITGIVPEVSYNGVKISTKELIVNSVQKFLITIVNNGPVPVSLDVSIGKLVLVGPSTVDPIF